MKPPNPQVVVQILRDERDERHDEVGDWRAVEGESETVRQLQDDVAALDYLLEEVEADNKPRIVRMLESEATYYAE